MTQQHGDGQPAQRQFVKFTFYKVDPAWRRIAAEERARARREIVDAVDAAGSRLLVRSYSLTGIRGDVDFLLWQVSERLEEFQALATSLYSTAMGPYLSEPHAYLAMTRRSIYRTPDAEEQADARLRVYPGESKYLFVYPFVKTRPWYELSKDARQEMMTDHITIGRKYPSVKLNTTYSYGIDDQEFVVSFETDSPSDFLDLVMELRETKASMYTLRDTPAFTCIRMPLPGVLAALGAPGDAHVDSKEPTRGAFEPVARLDEVPSGGAKVVYVAGEQVALFNLGGRVYAVSNRCSHANGPLAEGAIEGTAVTCPWHNSQFDLATGEPCGGPAQRPIARYDVRIEGGAVLLAPLPLQTPAG